MPIPLLFLRKVFFIEAEIKTLYLRDSQKRAQVVQSWQKRPEKGHFKSKRRVKSAARDHKKCCQTDLEFSISFFWSGVAGQRESTSLSLAWQVYSLLDGSETRCRIIRITVNDTIRIEPCCAHNAL